MVIFSISYKTHYTKPSNQTHPYFSFLLSGRRPHPPHSPFSFIFLHPHTFILVLPSKSSPFHCQLSFPPQIHIKPSHIRSWEFPLFTFFSDAELHFSSECLVSGDCERGGRQVSHLPLVLQVRFPLQLHFPHFPLFFSGLLRSTTMSGRFPANLGRRPAAVKLLLSLLNFVSLPTTCYVDL